MLKRYATKDQIKLLRHSFFQHLVTEIQSPLDLLQEYQRGLLGHHGRVSSHLKYPLVLQEYVALLQNYEAEYVLRDLTSPPDTLILWGSYAPYDKIYLVDHVLTEPDPNTHCAYILHEDQRTGILWIDWAEAENYQSPDSDITSYRCLCDLIL